MIKRVHSGSSSILMATIFRYASISWFEVVRKSVIDIFLQLAHLRVFQIILTPCTLFSCMQFISQTLTWSVAAVQQSLKDSKSAARTIRWARYDRNNFARVMYYQILQEVIKCSMWRSCKQNDEMLETFKVILFSGRRKILLLQLKSLQQSWPSWPPSPSPPPPLSPSIPWSSWQAYCPPPPCPSPSWPAWCSSPSPPPTLTWALTIYLATTRYWAINWWDNFSLLCLYIQNIIQPLRIPSLSAGAHSQSLPLSLQSLSLSVQSLHFPWFLNLRVFQAGDAARGGLVMRFGSEMSRLQNLFISLSELINANTRKSQQEK